MGQDLSGERTEVAQLNEEKISPWILFLPGIRGLQSVLVPGWVCHFRGGSLCSAGDHDHLSLPF